MKPVAVVLATFLLTGSAFAGQKDKIIGKQVRLPNHGLGTIVGRSEEGLIIMPVDANGSVLTRQQTGSRADEARISKVRPLRRNAI